LYIFIQLLSVCGAIYYSHGDYKEFNQKKNLIELLSRYIYVIPERRLVRLICYLGFNHIFNTSMGTFTSIHTTRYHKGYQWCLFLLSINIDINHSSILWQGTYIQNVYLYNYCLSAEQFTIAMAITKNLIRKTT
jgi:hypothetical protein